MFTILGIDIGSVAISIAMIDEKKVVQKTAYDFHRGAIPETLASLLNQFDISNLKGIAATSSTPNVINGSFSYDSQLCIISAVKHFHPKVGSILFIGAENFGLIKFNNKGEYESLKSNSSCAAGTGSFLDQQAIRLNLDDSSALSETAVNSNGDPPQIATRCAVFAKTDLIHAQQEGYSVGEISDGLCEGLVKNVIDTVMPEQNSVNTPLIFAGGVSMNAAVVHHLSKMLKVEPIIDDHSCLYGAIGAALLYFEERKPKQIDIAGVDSIIRPVDVKKVYGHDSLELKLSQYPEFSSLESYRFSSQLTHLEVEVDFYEKRRGSISVFIGIDIGSTSTKAVLIDDKNIILAGFYTRTSGQPIKAVQAIFEAMDTGVAKQGLILNICGVGTTGSGRKFIGKIINADLIVDEITAHARAAFELNSAVDTIIEIGGQDSKFTTIKEGMVTFSVMNNVCAAGTGSFIEEQAQKLGCPLNQVAEKAMGSPAPLSSDRCTVFMERDINNFLVNGYSVEEVFASIHHSVRENYLLRVAVEANIGDTICFQGATAKNKALVAAFEQKLKKPIFVSKYCHLTGALGSALILSEDKNMRSGFRGLRLYKEDIPFELEVCSLCHNNCKITTVHVQDDVVAFGFLCGRDYDTKRYVRTKKETFELLAARKEVEKFPAQPKNPILKIKVGIPSALFLADEAVIWKHFFNRLGVETVDSQISYEHLREGKSLCGTEFCAPMYAFFGHVKYLVEKVDYLFLPVYYENREKQKEGHRQYCYYSQYASSLAASIKGFNLKNRVIMPFIDARYFNVNAELFRILSPILKCSYWSIHSAYQGALEFYKESKVRLKNIFSREFDGAKGISVLLLGRPYTVLDRSMNKGIPDIFASMKVNTFYQDMIRYTKADVGELDGLLKALHWNYASKIVESALIAAKTEKLYPILITSFKCAPDSFMVEYFKRIMEKYQKPYLILQLDEHESSVGYDTRIEAAVRAFKNHSEKGKSGEVKDTALPVIPKVSLKLDGKTLLFPCWDPLCSKLLEAILINEGVDARMVPLTDKAIQLGPRTNTGMCLPVNIITQSYIDFIEESCLDPTQTVVWMFEAIIACNIKMFPYFIKSAFESYGRGLEKVSVYVGRITFLDVSYQASVDAYFAHMFGGMLRKMGCKTRPFEKERGLTDKIIAQSLSIFHNTFLGNRNKEDDVIKVVNLFKGIKTIPKERPKVAVLGDFYVRDNDVMNQDLNHCIEMYGGQVITTPFSEMAKVMANSYVKRSMRIGTFTDAIAIKAMMTLVNSMEKNFYKHFNEILDEPQGEFSIDDKEIFDLFNLKLNHHGETADNLLTSFALMARFPDISLFVQTNPAFCCAGALTEAMSSQIEALIGVPIVSLNYDGTSKSQNEKLIPYLKFYQNRSNTLQPFS